MVQGKDVCAMELDFKAIGKRIKIARIKKNFTQEAVADRIGVSPQHVSNIETGNSSVSLPTLVAIANMFYLYRLMNFYVILFLPLSPYLKEKQKIFSRIATNMKSVF